MSGNTKNVIERAAWTAAQALVGVAITEVAHLQLWWAAPVATGLSILKTILQSEPAPAAPTTGA
jgi:hypothetical protein